MSNRGRTWIISLATVVGSLVGTAHADTASLYQAAQKEGELTWYVSQVDGETAEAGGAAFTALYPGVKVNVVRITTQVAYQRVNQELAHKVLVADVFSTTDIGQYKTLKAKGELAQYRPENAGKLSGAFQNFDPDGFYYPTYAGEVVMAFNTQKLSAAEAPKSWHDLLDPKWKGKITVGDPAFSGYAGNWVILMRKIYGWSYFEDLKKNDPLITRSIIDTVNFLNSGERLVGVSPSASVLQSIDRGNPVQIIYPSDGAVLMIAPSAVLAKAPHPNAARLFLEFLLSADYAKVAVKSRGEALRPDVPSLPGVKTVNEIKTIRATDEEVIDGIPKIIEEWRDLFGG